MKKEDREGESQSKKKGKRDSEKDRELKEN
jgi:hypothetical protein